MPEAWREVAVDGEPDSDMSGNVSLYEIYDANAEAPEVKLMGRFNDAWMYGERATHWKPWVQSDAPSVAPEIWHEVATEGNPETDAPITLFEIFDGDSTGLTAWYLNRWLVPSELTVTHWKLPRLSDAPA
ncbi:hypothetical protein K2Z84_05215 [Candidatus Binatia bacterium]|nr:hypothetical protein [Candidatus Binatia bacterium]